MKLHLRVDHSDEDTLIASLTTAARDYIEAATSRRLVTTALRVEFPCFASPIWLPGSPLIAVQSVKYLDANGTQQTLASTNYDVVTNTEPGRLQLSATGNWPTTKQSPIAVQVNYTAGYGAASAVPDTAKAAIKLLAGHWYDSRSAAGNAMSEIPFGVQALIDQLKVLEA